MDDTEEMPNITQQISETLTFLDAFSMNTPPVSTQNNETEGNGLSTGESDTSSMSDNENKHLTLNDLLSIGFQEFTLLDNGLKLEDT